MSDQLHKQLVVAHDTGVLVVILDQNPETGHVEVTLSGFWNNAPGQKDLAKLEKRGLRPSHPEACKTALRKLLKARGTFNVKRLSEQSPKPSELTVWTVQVISSGQPHLNSRAIQQVLNTCHHTKWKSGVKVVKGWLHKHRAAQTTSN